MTQRYAVGGLDWHGSSRAIGIAWSAKLPPVQKLVLIRYADCPATPEEVAEWAGLFPDEALAITRLLVASGLVDEAYEPPPTAPTLAEIRAIVFERDGHLCQHCGTTERLSLDHIYPKSLGGSDEIDNLQTLCVSCNSRKGTSIQ